LGDIDVLKTVIAIDGPAGSGKSTVAKLISQKRGIFYLDTGAMYRAVAYKIIKDKLDITDNDKIQQFCSKLKLEIKFDGDTQVTMLDGVDVSNKIRTEEISKKASDIAVIPQIRLLLVDIQRKFGEENGCVVDGRDIGTYVFPDAQHKFFITASSHERAMRRYQEYLAQNQVISFEDLKKQIEARDFNDMNRKFAPLKRAEDAILIDTTGLSIDEVLNKIYSYIDKKVK
jgi:cytidylate kinase